jgi:hypothetical protein
VYGYKGRITAAVTFNHGIWLEFYQRLIEQAAPFPPDFPSVDRANGLRPVSAEVPARIVPAMEATVVVTGHDPAERHVSLVQGLR